MSAPFAPATPGPRIVGLCEGFGGLTLAAKAVLGGELVAYAEIKPAAVALLADRFPGVPNLGDLTLADWASVEAELVLAGWPCQPHSTAGQQLGEEDPRAIFPAVLDVIRVVRPALFIGENVARIATNGELRRAVRSLAAIGYVGTWPCLPAGDASIGAPHKRDRLCLVAVDAHADLDVVEGWLRALDLGDGPARELTGDAWMLPTPAARDSKGRSARAPVRSDGRARNIRHESLLNAVESLLPTPTARLGHSRSLPSARLGQARLDAGRRNLEDAVAAKLLPVSPSEAIDADRWGAYSDAVARWEEAIGRPAPEPTRPSLSPPHSPQLSPEFVEWMMGLEKGWVTDGAPGLGHNANGKHTVRGERNAMLSLLGDGVVVPWATVQIAHLLPLALAEARAAQAAGMTGRDPEEEVCVVADMAATVEWLRHLARNAKRAGLWTDRVRDRFTARKPVVQTKAILREALEAKDVDTLKALARRAVREGVWTDEVRGEFSSRRQAIEEAA